ncbi:hypothetical protein CC86DRAFT_334935 [Ophiobolus disseminans]|uniref:Uncharacterized protein n=1 Tax=Ophiobolus disseminans TaxID=1469910 RepID=A0A6A6ZFC7_9PLEO|nr:hypothetical protein CC86DRAFT_334935 [Ophiobolus disseminans]
MAPKRGGGGGSSSSSSISSCPGAFATVPQQVFFANDVVFFAIMLGISIAMCTLRKRTGAGKKLVGIPFIASVLCLVVAYACSIVATVLQECETTSYFSYYNWAIAISIFLNLGYWLLLFVVVFTLNTMLQAQLSHASNLYKYLLLAVVGLMAALTCGQIGFSSYINWSQTELGRSTRSYRHVPYLVAQQYRAAFYSLYLVSVLASGALALKTILSLRSRRGPAGDLIGWVIALTISMVLWVILMLVFVAWYLQNVDYSWESAAAVNYILNFGQALSYIFILCIAKHSAWSKSTVADPMSTLDAYAGAPPQQHYANSNGQAYYYQQQPVYNGAVNPIKA